MMFAVGCLLTECSSNLGLKVDLKHDGVIGMLPVFENRETAEKEYPNFPIIELMSNQNENR